MSKPSNRGFQEDSEPETPKRSKQVLFPKIIPVRVTFDMHEELRIIALYEHKDGKSPLIRDWITQKLQGYLRNPHYLRWKKKLG